MPWVGPQKIKTERKEGGKEGKKEGRKVGTEGRKISTKVPLLQAATN